MPKSKTAISPLDAHLGYWLRYVSNQVSHAFSLKVAQEGVTVAEWVVLRELADQDWMPSALAEHLGMTRGAISKLAERLIEKGLIARVADEADRRVQTLSLTRAGANKVPRLAALADANDAEFFGHLDRKTQENLKHVMKEIVRLRDLRHVPLD